ncbi:MAG: hypothetical protein V4764_03645 [Burkholderia sp.]
MFRAGREAAVLDKRPPPGRQADKSKARRARSFIFSNHSNEDSNQHINTYSIRGARFVFIFELTEAHWRGIGGAFGALRRRPPPIDGNRADSMTI